MILHLGEDCFVPLASVMLITPYDEAEKNRDTRAFLKRLNKVKISQIKKPKSVAIVEECGAYNAYISPISASTLFKRAGLNPFGEYNYD